MGTRRNFTQLRGIPFPVGIPTIQYVPYIFGQMRPLHVVPFVADLTVSFNPFASIIIPANIWGDFKLMYFKFGFVSTLVAGHDVSPAVIDQYYNVNPTSSVWIGRCTYDSASVANGRGALEYRFIRIGDSIYDWGSGELQDAPLVGRGIATDRYIRANGSLGVVDFTTQFEFQMILDVRGALLGDTVTTQWAQAYIQSPLDLRRLPR